MVRKSKATATKPRRGKKPRSTPPAPTAFTTTLPQGCTPAEKLAALEAMAAAQGVQPIGNPAEMIGDFWPEDESADDFLAARKRWQREGRERKL